MAEELFKKIVVSAHVEVEFDLVYWRSGEALAKELDDMCKDFMDFVRDHRSQDIHGLYVIREFAHKCQGCGHVYYSDSPPDEPDCCEQAARSWATPQILKEMGYE